MHKPLFVTPTINGTVQREKRGVESCDVDSGGRRTGRRDNGPVHLLLVDSNEEANNMGLECHGDGLRMGEWMMALFFEDKDKRPGTWS